MVRKTTAATDASSRGHGSKRAYRALIARSLARFALEIGKNSIKSLIGREPLRGNLYQLCSRHFWYFVRFRPIEKLTVTAYRNREGAGSRALMTMFTIAWCRAYGIAYVHTPFSRLAHVEGDQAGWDASWEAFFNLGRDEVPAGARTSEAFDYFLLSYLKVPGAKNWIEHVRPTLRENPAQYYLDIPPGEDEAKHQQRFTDILQAQLPVFRARYLVNKEAAPKRPFTVCVHIRRGDVSPELDDMWTQLSSYARCLDLIQVSLSRLGVVHTIEICSEGEREDFRDLDSYDAEWFLNEEAQHSMRRLIDADVIVSAKSCFSYVAALLSEAVVVFEPGYLPGLDGWIARDKFGNFDQAVLERRLQAVAAK